MSKVALVYVFRLPSKIYYQICIQSTIFKNVNMNDANKDFAFVLSGLRMNTALISSSCTTTITTNGSK